jgi:O-antigen ligase
VRGAALVLLALAGGAGTAYAPTATFAVVGVVFAAGLWLIMGGGRAVAPKSAPAPTFDLYVREENRAVHSPGVWITRAVSAYLLAFWVVLVMPMTEVVPAREVGLQAAQAAADGSSKTQILILLYGLIGLLFLPAALKRFSESFRLVLALWLLYLCWGYASLYWTSYAPLTLRGLVAFALVSLGSLGLGAGFYGARPDGARLLLRHLFVAGVISALAIIAPMVIHPSHAISILDPSQRLWVDGHFTRYISRPVMLALLVIVMTSILGLRRWRNIDFVWVVVLLIPILALKTRGPLLFTLLTLAIVYLLYRAQLQYRVMQAGMLLLVVVGTYVSYLRGFIDLLLPFLTRGDLESTLTLTRRTPLWAFLETKAQEHLITGAGFSAFWNPENLAKVKAAVGFPVVSAHNGFLEEVLATGLVGLGLFLAFWIYTMTLAARRARLGDPLGWLLLLFMVFYLTLNITTSLLQNHLELPMIAVFALVGLMAVRQVPRSSDPHRAPETAAGAAGRRKARPLGVGER